jgi:hypothetical protein
MRTVMTENIIGVWKQRFPCLRMGLRTRVVTAMEIVRATGVLHNLAVIYQDPVPEDLNDDPNQAFDNDDEGGEVDAPLNELGVRLQGVAHRDNVFANFVRRR